MGVLKPKFKQGDVIQLENSSTSYHWLVCGIKNHYYILQNITTLDVSDSCINSIDKVDDICVKVKQ